MVVTNKDIQQSIVYNYLIDYILILIITILLYNILNFNVPPYGGSQPSSQLIDGAGQRSQATQ
jgi:hypothetical protein